MENFNYYNPVNIIFGKGSIKELANLIDKSKKVLLVYGGGSIKKNGVYYQVKEALKKHKVFEFSGIEPNPKFETCIKAVEVIRKENIDFLLAVGGGSVLDGTKFIAAAAKVDIGKEWDTIICGTGTANIPELKEALPLASVITLPATGSEMNCAGVISKKETGEKFIFVSSFLFPKFSIIDPETTFSLPKKQVINGIIDSYIHTVEQYITYDVNTPLQDRQAEAILATLIEEVDKILSDPPDYDSRANFFWCATQALNGNIACGVISDWATHIIGHELTALYGLDHGQTLAIVLPQLWRNQKKNKAKKLLQYGKRIFGINISNENNAIEQAIQKTEKFFKKTGMKIKLSDYGINAEEAAEKVSNKFRKKNIMLGEKQLITPDIIKEILINC